VYLVAVCVDLLMFSVLLELSFDPVSGGRLLPASQCLVPVPADSRLNALVSALADLPNLWMVVGISLNVAGVDHQRTFSS